MLIKSSHITAKLVEIELVVVLAMVLMLGILFGYSLAKSTITISPTSAIMGESFSSDSLR
ncbi:hypothetical protein A3K24_03065 [candidate division Kazan bacterium RIFCSPHIGHO2_01_FULL_44_14]|uniref:Uncharacterized protein n=1 Tax=candidate division Kazan bacterium RIFCSPLOWO2_01_FULL_45_19 TaxID=1798538 RepID=A0A1F4NSA9_UNCK3|nr:MAG: hypothetical protein A3K51_03065 [candidate division Kazan bacterium RIFCSPLOWO2_01_FULL_45_19]OGB78027.1 MAG: hypothetical protein A3K24_03065 [candidate division Kazan bacterium RIFCSPHIGHO2_01_FULL_44_14]